MFINSIILLSPHAADRSLGLLICPVQRSKQTEKSGEDKMRDAGGVKEFHFIRGGRYYEHIYPKLENNEERLKPSQYFRCSKWTTSPAGDNGPRTSRHYYVPQMRVNM